MTQSVFKQDVFNVLHHAGATALRSADLGDGLSVAQWYNEDGEAAYDQPGHHTFSIYLNGGQSVERIYSNGPRIGGAPGKICLLPEDHRSRWHIPKPLEMFHLYFSPEKIKSLAMQVLDRDPRQVELQDLTFEADNYAENILKYAVLPLDWEEKSNKLALTAAADLFMIHILKNYARQPADLPDVKGGLPKHICKRLDEYLHTHFGEAMGIEDLSALAGYSSYHFARMFKQSFALPPHKYLNNIRIQKAKEMLAAGRLSIAEVSLACGFSSQAHFTNSFKKAVGLTPRQFQTL
ncbi:helix-turn-helix domain-containing protein [Sneathiella sp. P13V-1]|uniref:helix-turn-helix transcriptional regulator n=1 Tax=Sneathiella sp. P13V-1 TaxID=2697366 RepID=UPI00187B5CD3|nr:AraC family transcriptional regulator [Sneathiella sp. P13V-1]MBE7636585.1 helix-turn-helix domain-containing protein [Sneathiella sp. P13V-1]